MKGVITAGGEGTRLYPISRAYPKELISFCGKPVIEYAIELLKNNDIRDIIVVTGRKKGALQDYLGSGEIFGVNIAYVTQEEPKGLGHAVLTTEPYIDNEFVLMLGDTVFTEYRDLKEMIKINKDKNANSSILVEHVKEPERYGVVKFSGMNQDYGTIEDLYEKPVQQKIKNEFKANSGWYAIAGLYVFKDDIFKYLKRTEKGINNEIHLTDAIRLCLRDGNTVLGHKLKGRRIDIGTWDYLFDEWKTYKNMEEKEIEEIISARKDIMEQIKENRKK